jgi:hypothetical protein
VVVMGAVVGVGDWVGDGVVVIYAECSYSNYSDIYVCNDSRNNNYFNILNDDDDYDNNNNNCTFTSAC